jgi:hypothetical protein
MMESLLPFGTASIGIARVAHAAPGYFPIVRNGRRTDKAGNSRIQSHIAVSCGGRIAAINMFNVKGKPTLQRPGRVVNGMHGWPA